MVKIEEIDDSSQGEDKFKDLLKRIRAKNFEAGDDSESGEMEEVAETVCSSLQK